MAQLSDRLQRLAPSATLAMSQKSSEMKAQGIDVINMSVGEPDFNTPDHIKEAAKKAVDENYSRYSPVPGYPDLRKAIVAKLKNENNLDYSVNEILVSNGAKQSVCNTVMALVNPGDEVIIPAPYWVSYPQMVKLAGGNPVIVEAGFDQNFKMTPEQLEAAITPKTRLIILCSPSNPTGSVYSKEELAGLADVIKQHEDLFVLADEIYEHINYIGRHESIAQFEGMKERAIIVNGVSKAYAMTGWRIGYIAAPEWIVKGCNKLQGQYTSGPCSVSQKAAEFAYVSSQECVEQMRQAFERRRNLIVELAKDIPGLEVNVPEGAFYLFPKCSSFFGKSDGTTVVKNSTDLALYLLEKGHVATVGGDAFGDPECFRMSYATSDDNIREAMRRIKESLAELK
ncbi:pyridoxal phosphate-dependent aminotransferase [Prevotella sp. P2-180]|uniref:pyridoxal phosphate-dependent aminotransferase n=1 Tax=Prevotella sp. P2-180 TaxID=2024224 RepID=UPI000B97419C|nr:pyridoxal phosphate-dependent aminotransferase [Prevotella sp. P2-180]MCI6338462.1 pyridoxal phosphate-dependent aminotransferase [Prevotella sp.]MCI7089956.1 pyridoxal phosphate-dependent aminotransferase [Prevotella sp.]MCI7257287.1 pyridoxal phosphate-dependent aminotransferase [Prevotella sp.]MDD6864017.1 pyridoxal phosphate-dependent aminotransferase [Prevotella sp.]MDD7226397.1 pyridoxal phosphate-dependent aminotransferase [Prevotella sp.]